MPEMYSEDMTARFRQIFKYMREGQEAVYRRNARLYQNNTKQFEEGDKVWYLCPRQVQGKPPKITDTWLGPYVIRKRKAEVLFQISPWE